LTRLSSSLSDFYKLTLQPLKTMPWHRKPKELTGAVEGATMKEGREEDRPRHHTFVPPPFTNAQRLAKETGTVESIKQQQFRRQR
jgi:hypothetical protein